MKKALALCTILGACSVQQLSPEQQALIGCSNFLKAAKSVSVWDDLGYLTPDQHTAFVAVFDQVYPICVSDQPPASAGATIDQALDQVEALLEAAVAADAKRKQGSQ